MDIKKSGLKALRYLQDIDRDDVLESLGLQERRSALATTLGSLGIFVLGCLVGADVLNLALVARLNAPIASIGGAGTFDGVFVSGVIAVLLA